MKDPRRRTKPKQERSVATHDAILDATSLLAAELGITSVGVRAVMRRAGVSSGTLYQYFASREALVAAWELRELGKGAHQLMGVMSLLLQKQPTMAEAIRVTISSGVDILVAHILKFRDFELGTFLSERKGLYDNLVSGVMGVLSAAQKRDELQPKHLEFAVRLLSVAVFHGAIQVASAASDDDRAKLRDELADMGVRYLLAKNV